MLVKILGIVAIIAIVGVVVYLAKKKTTKETNHEIEVNPESESNEVLGGDTTITKRSDDKNHEGVDDNLKNGKTKENLHNDGGQLDMRGSVPVKDIVTTIQFDEPFAYWFVTTTNIEAFARAYNENSFAARYTEKSVQTDLVDYKDVDGIHDVVELNTHLYVWVMDSNDTVIATGEYDYTPYDPTSVAIMSHK